MKILIDIGHPAHVHIFRNLASELGKDGHDVLFTCREKENVIALLKAYQLPYVTFGRPFKNKIGKILGLIIFNIKMMRTLLKFRPGITLGHSSMYAAQMSWLLGIPHISVEDTGNMEQIVLYRPFTKAILVPVSFHRDLGSKQIRYYGNHELAYLHPNRFTPDPDFFSKNKPHISKPFVILRFVAWNASHDTGQRGLSIKDKLFAVNEFSKHATVVISSEKELPPEFGKYLLHIPPEKIHNLISQASLLYGESATMASEAAILGTPAIYLDNVGRSYTREEEEQYGLVFNYTTSEQDFQASVSKGLELLKDLSSKEMWKKKSERMLDDKIDVTAFMKWFVEQWPKSYGIMKADPEYQKTFK
ncbi:MAG: DUF354 domain-containing protein [Bacteroidetes bacterium]|nr:DUF354 domain-containing protein [Bacteroidota bacterium]